MQNNDSGPPDSKVLNWLKKHGYFLEMRVAQILKQTGFEVSHFENYIDPESNDLREIDIVASIKHQTDEFSVSAVLFIECKYLRHPWVIFTSPRHSSPYAYFSRILNENYTVHKWKDYESIQGRLLAKVLRSLGRENTTRFDFFTMPSNVGYAITESLRGNPRANDNAFIATMQVSKCIEAHDIEMEANFQRTTEEYQEHLYGLTTGRDKLSLFCSIAFPIIVAQGKLFECCLNSNNEIAIVETNESLVLVSNKNRSEKSKAGPCTSSVKVVTESYVQSFAKEAYRAATALLSQEEAIKELWEYERSKVLGETRDEIPF